MELTPAILKRLKHKGCEFIIGWMDEYWPVYCSEQATIMRHDLGGLWFCEKHAHSLVTRDESEKSV